MPHYAALLRGIAPLNPNMRNDKLRSVFESLGFANVRTVISSGNVLFESPRTNVPKLEHDIEAAIVAQLGFTSTTIIRSRAQLQKLVDSNPFGEATHTQKTYLTVTFLKDKPSVHLPPSSHELYSIAHIYPKEVCSIVDLASAKTPQLMAHLERKLGKNITTRTWKTVLRILKIL